VWLRVVLPVRPNGRRGWIPADNAVLQRLRWRLTVSTERRTVSAYRDGRLRRRIRAVVGKPATPTPHGLFAIYEVVPQADPGGFDGPWVLHLTAFSDVLRHFGGGPGRVAIHGRAGASLRDPLGTARSHGCVRIDNADVRFLSRVAVPGTPVRIR
jgi:lipoprotein-anchoring transpeptidase ErfK/SrfK